ncbi:flagellar biosynthesis anti-sigma factor FlgM [Thiomonas intermedia]|uniref:flagellar biosynthesis anti-sigma factor FlgM n=1 Tax=Thiomonas intermedia TaxID=926 RepID=UPI0009A525E2|nr:flagellar biosynthesis anti-sigma factor FlgM [Thiomonas intermedia]
MIPIQNSAISSASTATSGTTAASRRAGAAPSGASGSGEAGQLNPSAAPSTEQVSISGAGQMLNLASTQGITPPASDTRINELRSAIESGQYVVDPQRISQGLLQDSQALIGASKPAAN